MKRNYKFITKIYHPGVCSKTGDVCLELTNDQRVNPRNAFHEIKSFLIDPTESANYPIEGQIADQYFQNRDLFE